MPLTIDDYVPIELWHKDHWTTLAYIETVMVDSAGFQVGADPHMRSNRRNFRVMQQQCRRPKRARGSSPDLCVVMEEKYSTILSDGSTIIGHDDWSCIQDMAEAGFFTVGPDGVEPAETLHLSDLGRNVANALREFKSDGGKYGDFKWSIAGTEARPS